MLHNSPKQIKAFIDIPASKINFAERMPNGELKIAQMTPADLAVKAGQKFKWLETIQVDEQDAKDLPELKDGFRLDKEQLYTAISVMAKNRNKLAVSYINDAIGYGVIAIEDIPANALLAFYTGNYVPVSGRHPLETLSSRYGHAVASEGIHVGVIQADNNRNIAAFIQHSPEKGDYVFDSSVNEDTVAFANIALTAMNYDNFPLIGLQAKGPIPKGAILGYDYSLEYFLNHGICPRVCTTNGELIKSDLHTSTLLTMRIFEENGQGRLMDIVVDRESHRASFKNGPTIVKNEVDGERYYLSKEDYDAAIKKFPPGSPYIIFPQPTGKVFISSNKKLAFVPFIKKEGKPAPSSQFATGQTLFDTAVDTKTVPPAAAKESTLLKPN